MRRSAKKVEESSGDIRRSSRLLRGWVQCVPNWEEIRTEDEFRRRGGVPPERAIEEPLLLQEEIERAQWAIRELIGPGSEATSGPPEEGASHASENARLWRAVAHLAEALDSLLGRVELIERRDAQARDR